MNLKVLFAVFLCLFSTFIICNVAMVIVNAAEGWSCKAFSYVEHAGYLTNNRIQPTGDPREGGGWPQ